jgi:aspartyl aminopeptidase
MTKDMVDDTNDLGVRKNNILISKWLTQELSIQDIIPVIYQNDYENNKEQYNKLKNPLSMIKELNYLIHDLCNKLKQFFKLESDDYLLNINDYKSLRL